MKIEFGPRRLIDEMSEWESRGRKEKRREEREEGGKRTGVIHFS